MDRNYLSPYDTGARCEPKPWPAPSLLTLEHASPGVLRSEEDRFGRVDFEDDSSETVCTVYVSRDDAGTFTVHVEPMSDDVKVCVDFDD